MTAGRSLAENSSPAFETQDYRTREVMKDLHGVKPAIYWTDFLMSALTGWTAFAMAVRAAPVFSRDALFSGCGNGSFLSRTLLHSRDQPSEQKGVAGFRSGMESSDGISAADAVVCLRGGASKVITS